jgi:hypothetical protein
MRDGWMKGGVDVDLIYYIAEKKRRACLFFCFLNIAIIFF